MPRQNIPVPPLVQRLADENNRIAPETLTKSAMLYAVHELSRMISTYFDRVMAEHDLTHAQWWTIMHVIFHEGKSQAELARIMQMGRSAAGKMIDQLERKGWIERRQDEDDLRVLRVYMAPGELPDFAAFTLGGEQLFGTFLEGLDSAEILATLTSLQKIQCNGEKALKEHARDEKRAARKDRPIGMPDRIKPDQGKASSGSKGRSGT